MSEPDWPYRNFGVREAGKAHDRRPRFAQALTHDARRKLRGRKFLRKRSLRRERESELAVIKIRFGGRVRGLPIAERRTWVVFRGKRSERRLHVRSLEPYGARPRFAEHAEVAILIGGLVRRDLRHGDFCRAIDKHEVLRPLREHIVLEARGQKFGHAGFRGHDVRIGRHSPLAYEPARNRALDLAVKSGVLRRVFETRNSKLFGGRSNVVARARLVGRNGGVDARRDDLPILDLCAGTRDRSVEPIHFSRGGREPRGRHKPLGSRTVCVIDRDRSFGFFGNFGLSGRREKLGEISLVVEHLGGDEILGYVRFTDPFARRERPLILPRRFCEIQCNGRPSEHDIHRPHPRDKSHDDRRGNVQRLPAESPPRFFLGFFRRHHFYGVHGERFLRRHGLASFYRFYFRRRDLSRGCGDGRHRSKRLRKRPRPRFLFRSALRRAFRGDHVNRHDVGTRAHFLTRGEKRVARLEPARICQSKHFFVDGLHYHLFSVDVRLPLQDLEVRDGLPKNGFLGDYEGKFRILIVSDRLDYIGYCRVFFNNDLFHLRHLSLYFTS